MHQKGLWDGSRGATFFYHTNNMMEEGVDLHIPPAAALLTDETVTNVTTTIHQVTQSQSVDPEAQGIPFGPPSLHHPQQSLSFCCVHSNSGDSHGLFGTEVSPFKKRRIGSPARSVATGHPLDMAGALGTKRMTRDCRRARRESFTAFQLGAVNESTFTSVHLLTLRTVVTVRCCFWLIGPRQKSRENMTSFT